MRCLRSSNVYALCIYPEPFVLSHTDMVAALVQWCSEPRVTRGPDSIEICDITIHTSTQCNNVCISYTNLIQMLTPVILLVLP